MNEKEPMTALAVYNNGDKAWQLLIPTKVLFLLSQLANTPGRATIVSKIVLEEVENESLR